MALKDIIVIISAKTTSNLDIPKRFSYVIIALKFDLCLN